MFEAVLRDFRQVTLQWSSILKTIRQSVVSSIIVIEQCPRDYGGITIVLLLDNQSGKG